MSDSEQLRPRTFQEHTDLVKRLQNQGWSGEDKDGDGFISLKEWLDRNKSVSMIYASHSGRLYESEYLESIFGPLADRISGPAIRGGRSSPYKVEFQKYDIGHKGYLTMKELENMFLVRFKNLDRNKDGRLTPIEASGTR